MGYSIVPITESDWRQLKTLRLEALGDTPNAYLETLAAGLELTDADWQFRARRGVGPNNVALAALDTDLGDWVGMMGSFVVDRRATLYGVYVRALHRGRAAGVANALLDGIENWVATVAGLTELFLQVHEHNERAQAFYLRRGYRFTGGREPYPLNPDENELEMSRAVSRQSARPDDRPAT